ncbi:MAG: nitrogenase component 1 [Methanolinea sp.]|nr:nitrogenase component 1 [Methanolinea sp.]
MHVCDGSLWPCALTGAAAALAETGGVGVVVHGSLGCYYYPASVLHASLHCTSLSEKDIVLGTRDALARTIDAIAHRYEMIAVLCTCVPAVTGEEIREILEERYGERPRFSVIETPGFSGGYEEGYRRATAALCAGLRADGEGVNIVGLSPYDLSSAGDLREARRILSACGIPAGAIPATRHYAYGRPLSRLRVSTNPDLDVPLGEGAGTILGLSNLARALERLDPESESTAEILDDEIPEAEEKVIAACDRFLRRFDPPRVALFGQCLSMREIGTMLERYLDADILVVGSRNEPVPGRFRVEPARNYASVRDILSSESPDLVLGSSFERHACPNAAFVGVTPPLRGVFRLTPRPLAGIEGTLSLFESVLNACADRAARSTRGGT